MFAGNIFEDSDPHTNDIQCPLASFICKESRQAVSGIHLVHLADQATVSPGQTLTFTAWILNSTTETLTDICLKLRSFTNDNLESLSYGSRPNEQELASRILRPRQSLGYTLTYVVPETKDFRGGLLISALQAELSFPGMGRLMSECDALSTVRKDSLRHEDAR